MNKIVFDIETVGDQFDTLAPSVQEYMLRDSLKEDTEEKQQKKAEEIKTWTSLFPLTAKVVVIGMYLIGPDSKAFVYYDSEEAEEYTKELDSHANDGSTVTATLKGMPEKQMLEKFWNIFRHPDYADAQIISFNGRGFDLPFLMLRSAKLGVPVSKNFMGYRFDSKSHVDLLEQLTFYGTTRKFNLDYYCQGFGIKSPKSKEMSGYEVPRLYREGKVKEVAEYCAGDILATYRLFEIWNNYINTAR